MPDDIVHFVGLVLLVAVLAVSHPVRPGAFAALSERVADSWADFQQTGPCDIQEPMSCMQPIAMP